MESFTPKSETIETNKRLHVKSLHINYIQNSVTSVTHEMREPAK